MDPSWVTTRQNLTANNRPLPPPSTAPQVRLPLSESSSASHGKKPEGSPNQKWLVDFLIHFRWKTDGKKWDAKVSPTN